MLLALRQARANAGDVIINRHRMAWLAIIIGMVALATSGLLSMLEAALVAAGILAVFFGYWIGLALVTAGIFSIYLSLKLRKLKGLPQKISSELNERFQSVQDEIRKELGK